MSTEYQQRHRFPRFFTKLQYLKDGFIAIGCIAITVTITV